MTIPGATCAGQRVMLAAHPDETPVPTDIVGADRLRHDERHDRLRRGAPAHHRQQPGQRGRLRRAVRRRADHGRVQRAAALVRRERHLPQADAEGHAARRIARQDGQRPVQPRGLGLLREQPHPVRAAGPVRPVRQHGLARAWTTRPTTSAPSSSGTTSPAAASARGSRSSRPRRPRRTRPTRTPAPARPARTSRPTPRRSASCTPTCSRPSRPASTSRAAKYNFSVPLENPLRYNQTGQAPNPYSGVVPTKPAYSAATRRSTRRSATTPTRLEDEQAFFDKGIPGFTVSGVKNSNSRREPVRGLGQRNAQGDAGDRVRRQPDDVPARQRHAAARHDDARGAPRRPGDTTVTVADVTNLDRRPADLRRHRREHRVRPDPVDQTAPAVTLASAR